MREQLISFGISTFAAFSRLMLFIDRNITHIASRLLSTKIQRNWFILMKWARIGFPLYALGMAGMVLLALYVYVDNLAIKYIILGITLGWFLFVNFSLHYRTEYWALSNWTGFTLHLHMNFRKSKFEIKSSTNELIQIMEIIKTTKSDTLVLNSVLLMREAAPRLIQRSLQAAARSHGLVVSLVEDEVRQLGLLQDLLLPGYQERRASNQGPTLTRRMVFKIKLH